MDLDELAGDEIQRLVVAAHEHVMADGGRQHAARDELEREMLDGHGGTVLRRRVERCVAGAPRRAAYTTGDRCAARGASARTGSRFSIEHAPMTEPAAAAAAPALSVRDLRKTYDNGVEALKGVSLDVHARRLLRPARPQRRRQVDPDRHRQLAGQPQRRLGVDLRHRPGARPRRRDAPDRPGAAGTQLQHVREAARHPGATTPASTACRARRRCKRAEEELRARASVGEGAR